MLSYALLRERVLFNNSLDSYEEVPGYGHNLDKYYHDKAIENEKLISKIKIDQPKILSKMIDFLMACDSKRFCSEIIG